MGRRLFAVAACALACVLLAGTGGMFGHAQPPDAVSAAAMPGTRVLGQLACPAAYHCRGVRRYVCMQKGAFKPVISRTARTPCTAYAATIAFRFAANGKYVQIVPHSLHCRVHDPHVLVKLRCQADYPGKLVNGFLEVAAQFDGSRTTLHPPDPQFPYDYRFYVLCYALSTGRSDIELLTA